MADGWPVLGCAVVTNPSLRVRGACRCPPVQEGAPCWLPPAQPLRLGSGLPLSAPRGNVARPRGRADPAAGALHQRLQARCSEESSLSLPQKEREKDEAVLHFRVSVTAAAGDVPQSSPGELAALSVLSVPPLTKCPPSGPCTRKMASGAKPSLGAFCPVVRRSPKPQVTKKEQLLGLFQLS